MLFEDDLRVFHDFKNDFYKWMEKYMLKIEKTLLPRTSVHIFFLTKDQANDVEHFTGDYKESVVFYKKNQIEMYVGLGIPKEIDLEKIRTSVGLALSKAKTFKKDEVSLFFPKLSLLQPKDISQAFVEATVLSTYVFDKYKSDQKSEGFKNIEKVEYVGEEFSSEVLEYARVLAEGTCYTRDLVNDMAHVVTPVYLAEKAKELASAHKNCEVTIFDEKEIDEKGMGLLKAVGQGSNYPPRLIVLEYKGAPESKDIRAVVGKGITFDSGGLNLKPSGHIESMRYDMAGAAVSLGLFKTAVELGLKVNLVCAVATACNSIGSKSYFPGDIYKSYSGKTVQIKNTDAEGRLVLADALTYVCEKYNPTQLVDLATLTGAIVVCLGNNIAGLFANDDQLAKNLFESGENTGERLWRLPLYKEYSEAMKGDLADLNNLSNIGKGAAGSITAAAFLQEFVKDTAWAHIDIAGVANSSKGGNGYIPKHATGFGVRLLINWLEKYDG
ncbi:hypothetical protein AB834_01970 [PVC group bacterium (ex Bugula neritina AB1)]|nr:hypothetical protein AB834_01970 [PVC group bacterium (ex Bugula neritina AB1)]